MTAYVSVKVKHRVTAVTSSTREGIGIGHNYFIAMNHLAIPISANLVVELFMRGDIV